MENDLALLFDEANKSKVEKRADKLGATRGGQELDKRLQNLESGVQAYMEAIAQLKGFNEGFINSTVKSA